MGARVENLNSFEIPSGRTTFVIVSNSKLVQLAKLDCFHDKRVTLEQTKSLKYQFLLTQIFYIRLIRLIPKKLELFFS